MHAVAPSVEVISMPLAAFIDIHFAKQRPREREREGFSGRLMDHKGHDW